jgi:hypothetical protein
MADSKRMRIRMRSLLVSIPSLTHSAIVQDKLGLDFNGWWDFFENAETRDLLDLVTRAYRFLADQDYMASACPSSKFLRQRAEQIKGGSGSSG